MNNPLIHLNKLNFTQPWNTFQHKILQFCQKTINKFIQLSSSRAFNKSEKSNKNFFTSYWQQLRWIFQWTRLILTNWHWNVFFLLWDWLNLFHNCLSWLLKERWEKNLIGICLNQRKRGDCIELINLSVFASILNSKIQLKSFKRLFNL